MSGSSIFVLTFLSLFLTSFEQLFTKCWSSWGSLGGLWYNSKLNLIICIPYDRSTLPVIVLFNIGFEMCRSQPCYSPDQHKIGWVHKVAHLVLLLKGQSELRYLWKNILMYGWRTVYPIKSLFFAVSDIDLNLLQYNFVGRLLGPRGNSLKRVEASTECRVLIRGRGSIKDPARVRINVHYVS